MDPKSFEDNEEALTNVENVDTIILSLPVLRESSPNDHEISEMTNEAAVVLTHNDEELPVSSSSLVRSDCGQLFLVTYEDGGKQVSGKPCFNFQIDTEQLLELKYCNDEITFYRPLDQPEDDNLLHQDIQDEVQSGDTLQLAMQEIDTEGEPLEPVPYEVKVAALEAMMMPDEESSENALPFNCGVCFKNFSRRYELKLHLARHFGMNVSLCPFCGKQFSHSSNLIRHVRIHTGSKPYKCKDCGKRFNQASSLHTHRASLHLYASESRKFGCPVCGRIYKTGQLLKRHCRIFHPEDNVRLELPVPNVPFRRRFYCSECGDSFFEKRQLKEHQHLQHFPELQHISETSPELQLNLEAIDSMLREIQNEERVAEGPDLSAITGQYSCTIEEVIHKIKNLICLHCGKQFQRYISYKQHWGVHESSMRSYQCELCGVSFAWKSTFNKHMAQHSLAERPESVKMVECSKTDCNKLYKTVAQMQEHVKRDHLKIRRFNCDQCDKQFYKAHDLIVHKRTHSKEKPYLCGTCGKSFSHVSHLIRHEKSHQNIRPYTCPVCHKAFTQATVLKAHRKKKCPDPTNLLPAETVAVQL